MKYRTAKIDFSSYNYDESITFKERSKNATGRKSVRDTSFQSILDCEMDRCRKIAEDKKRLVD